MKCKIDGDGIMHIQAESVYEAHTLRWWTTQREKRWEEIRRPVMEEANDSFRHAGSMCFCWGEDKANDV